MKAPEKETPCGEPLDGLSHPNARHRAVPANTRKARVVEAASLAPTTARVKSNAKRPAEAGRFMKRNQKLAMAT
jgi:hypothetical protein